MSNFFTAPDGIGDPTIWERTDGDPQVVVRFTELPGPHHDLLWRVLTGVLCADDETVERVAEEIFDEVPPATADDARDAARGVFATLRGER